jgi:hypothetical protein
MIKIYLLISLFVTLFSFSTDSTKSVSTQLDSMAIGEDSLMVKDSLMVDIVDSLAQSEPEITMPVHPKLVYPVVKNEAFFVGEKLLFDISYGFIHAGTATMEVKKEMLLHDKPVYHIQTTARSAAGFSWIFRVDDVIDSYIDKQGLFSWKFDKRLREGGYKVDFLVDYFPEDSLAEIAYTRYKRGMIITNQETYQVKTPPFVLDVLAAFYYTRTQNLELGQSISITNHDNKNIYDLEVHVYQKEIIDTDAGKFRCLFIEPLLKGEGIFKQKGRLKVWITDDQYKIPVKMRSEVAVGAITVELDEMKGLPYKIPALLAQHD